MQEGSVFFGPSNFQIFADVYFFLILDVCEVQLRLLGLVRSLAGPSGPVRLLQRSESQRLSLLVVRSREESESTLQDLRIAFVARVTLLCRAFFRGMLTISEESMVMPRSRAFELMSCTPLV